MNPTTRSAFFSYALILIILIVVFFLTPKPFKKEPVFEAKKSDIMIERINKF